MPHLWEIEHDYYCNQGNYFANDCRDSHGSWAEFMEEYADSDFDMNLVFRFDWYEGDFGGSEFNGDPNYRNGCLFIFWMGQRNGLYRYSEVQVCRADEPAVIEFLRPRWEHMRKLWEPISETVHQ